MNNLYTWRQIVPAKLFAVFTIVSLVLSAFPASFLTAHAQEEVLAELSQDVSKKLEVKICHWDEGHGGEYGSKTVALEATGPKGHGSDTHPNDIVPPVDTEGNSHEFELNWDTGQAIWNNNCNNGGTITVEKTVVGNAKVDEKSFKFEVDGKKIDEGKSKEFAIGSYLVTEKPKDETPTDFVPTFGGDCDASGNISIGAIGEDKVCKITNTYREIPVEESFTLHANKIVCEDEKYLPNWGKKYDSNNASETGPEMIVENTASRYLNYINEEEEVCKMARWQFQWAPAGTNDPGDNLGELTDPWKTFAGSTVIPYSAVGDSGYVWVREIWSDSYIPFTGQNVDQDVSAEFYAHIDGLHYDNYDRVDNIKVDGDYYMLGFNVHVEEPGVDIEMCKKDVTGAPVEGWIMGLSNGEQGNATRHTTEKDGCVTAVVDPTEGPWKVIEQEKKGWKFDHIDVEGGFVFGEGEGCVFFGEKTTESALAEKCGEDYKCETPQPDEYSCTFVNEEEESACKIGYNLLINGSFEEPVVENKNLWDKFWEVATGWVTQKVSDDSDTTLELHRGWKGNEAADGEQYAELDGDQPVRISQDVITEEGATYELSWSFAPRQGTDAVENELSVEVEGYGEVTTTGPSAGIGVLSQGDWTTPVAYEFEALSDSTEIAFSDLGPESTSGPDVGTFLDDAVLCKVKEAPLCEPEKNVWADEAVDSEQGTVKGGGTIPAGRSISGEATGESDWAPGGSDGFFSLGYDGWIEVSFEKFVVDVDGDDISIHEATNGTYPLETAKVEVSQDGSTWYTLSEEARNDSNDGGAGITLLDFSETGLSWIQYVRVTDTTDQDLHKNGTDGFDLDAVDATYVVCDEPEPNTYVIDGNKWNDEDGDGEWGEGEDGVPRWGIVVRPMDMDAFEGLDVPAQDAVVSTAGVLTDGNIYLVEASGTYSFGNRADYEADAEWSHRNDAYTDNPLLSHGWTVGELTYPSVVGLDLQIDGQNINWESFNEDHLYKTIVVGDGTGLDFFIHDSAYGDNTGGLHVEIYDVTDYVTYTDIDGYYSVEVEEGAYQVVEIMQDGWSQTYPTGPSYYHVDVPNQDEGGYDFGNKGPERPPVDVCGNLEGIQEIIPEGYEDVGEGVCMPIEQPGYCEDDSALNYSEEGACEYEEENGGEEERRSYSSGTRTGLGGTPTVEGAATSFCPFLEDYMQIGWENDSWEVTKLQMFLNMIMGEALKVDGIFGRETDEAVKRFQTRYHSEVIAPWFERGIVSHDRTTGFVYKTTKWKINDIVCPGVEPYPSFDGEDLTSNVDED